MVRGSLEIFSNVLDCYNKHDDFCKGKSMLRKELSLWYSFDPLLSNFDGKVLLSITLNMLGVFDLDPPRGLNTLSDVNEGISNLASDLSGFLFEL